MGSDSGDESDKIGSTTKYPRSGKIEEQRENGSITTRYEKDEKTDYDQTTGRMGKLQSGGIPAKEFTAAAKENERYFIARNGRVQTKEFISAMKKKQQDEQEQEEAKDKAE